MPRVSVLLPVHNAESTLREALASLAFQTMTDYEIVAVENGSTDDSLLILKAEAGTNPQLRVIEQAKPDLVSALNTGLAHYEGEFVARMDADDRCHPLRLECQLHEMDGCDVCGTGVSIFNAEGVREGYRNYEKWINGLITHDDMMRQRFIESPIPHPTAMFRRAWIDEMGGYRDCGWAEDYDLWLRGFAAGARFAKCDKLLYAWRDGPTRLSRSDPRYSQEAFVRCKVHYLVRTLFGEMRPLALWGAGPVGKRLLRCLRGRGLVPEIIIDIDPKKIGRTRQGIPVVAPQALRRAPHFVLTAAVRVGAREEIRAALAAMGYREGEDYYCCA